MNLDDFDYDLPEELIALDPAERRDGARLLHVRADGVGHHQFADLPSLLREGDLLVVNDTKVFPAALSARRPARALGGGGDVSVDVNLLHTVEEAPDHTVWRAFARPAKRVREGDLLFLSGDLTAEVIRRVEGEIDLSFDQPVAALLAAFDQIGRMPLPPYIARKRGYKDQDRERYQTVYADRSGSVAAPTAGLHFTDEIFKRLKGRGIEKVSVTLHVGAGTFLPVSSEHIEDHKMHSEWGEITPEAATMIDAAKRDGRRIVSVGTTSTRLLETAARKTGIVEPFCGDTDIFITPGFRFNVVDAMITNFHLPRSTLLMLIGAFAGVDRIRHAYAEAVARKYRFYSYGDACLLEKAL